MAARPGRLLFVLCFIAFALFGTAWAGESGIVRNATAMAGENLMRALPVLEQAMASCKEKKKIINIPRSDELGVERESLLLGLAYFSLKTENECTAPAAKEVLFAAKVLENSPLFQEEKDKSGAGFELVDLVVQEWWREVEAKARYEAQVPETERAKIQQIPCLDQPFDMIRSWNASGNK